MGWSDDPPTSQEVFLVLLKSLLLRGTPIEPQTAQLSPKKYETMKKNLSCLGYIRDEILPSYIGDYCTNPYKDPVTKQPEDSMESKARFFFSVVHLGYQDIIGCTT